MDSQCIGFLLFSSFEAWQSTSNVQIIVLRRILPSWLFRLCSCHFFFQSPQSASVDFRLLHAAISAEQDRPPHRDWLIAWHLLFYVSKWSWRLFSRHSRIQILNHITLQPAVSGVSWPANKGLRGECLGQVGKLQRLENVHKSN